MSNVASRSGKGGSLRAAAFQIDTMAGGLTREVGRPLHLRGLIIESPQGPEDRVVSTRRDARVGAGRLLRPQPAVLRAAHLVWDQAGFWKADADLLRRAAAEAGGIPFDAVLLTATHTHSGFWHPRDADPGYIDLVKSRLSGAVRDAVKRLEPVRAGWKTLPAPGIRRNRTVYLKDGSAYTERWAIPSSWRIPQKDILRRGPDDDELRILTLDRPDGGRLAVCANFSCHNSAALKERRITDDFFGVAAQIIEEVEGCVALISPGSEGDQDPTAVVELGGTRDMRYAARLGRRLAGYLLIGLADTETREDVGVGVGACCLEIPIREDWKPLARKLGNEEILRWIDAGSIPADVNALAIGGYAVVGIPAELFTTPAMRIKKHSPFEITAVSGLTNGMAMYLAEGDAFFDGSQIYGVHAQHYAAARPASDDLFVEAALRALRGAKEVQEEIP